MTFTDTLAWKLLGALLLLLVVLVMASCVYSAKREFEESEVKANGPENS